MALAVDTVCIDKLVVLVLVAVAFFAGMFVMERIYRRQPPVDTLPKKLPDPS